MLQENGEEILVTDPPRTRYIAGILFPHGAKEENNSDDEKDISVSNEDAADDEVNQGVDYSADVADMSKID